MRRIVLPLLIALFVLTSCGEISRGLQSMAQGMGGRCTRYTCTYGHYDAATQKYKMMYYKGKDARGNDISNQELKWVKSTSNYYMNSGIGVYYQTSPYSNTSYKFDVRCEQWAN